LACEIPMPAILPYRRPRHRMATFSPGPAQCIAERLPTALLLCFGYGRSREEIPAVTAAVFFVVVASLPYMYLFVPGWRPKAISCSELDVLDDCELNGPQSWCRSFCCLPVSQWDGRHSLLFS
jgi:hypothetical protein